MPFVHLFGGRPNIMYKDFENVVTSGFGVTSSCPVILRVFRLQLGTVRSHTTNSVSLDKPNIFYISFCVYFCTCHSVFKFECCGRLGALWRAVSRTTSDYFEPRSHESFVMNSRKKKQFFPDRFTSKRQKR